MASQKIRTINLMKVKIQFKKVLENINNKNPEQTQAKSIPLRLDIDFYSTHHYGSIISNF